MSDDDFMLTVSCAAGNLRAGLRMAFAKIAELEPGEEQDDIFALILLCRNQLDVIEHAFA